MLDWIAVDIITLCLHIVASETVDAAVDVKEKIDMYDLDDLTGDQEDKLEDSLALLTTL